MDILMLKATQVVNSGESIRKTPLGRPTQNGVEATTKSNSTDPPTSTIKNEKEAPRPGQKAPENMLDLFQSIKNLNSTFTAKLGLPEIQDQLKAIAFPPTSSGIVDLLGTFGTDTANLTVSKDQSVQPLFQAIAQSTQIPVQVRQILSGLLAKATMPESVTPLTAAQMIDMVRTPMPTPVPLPAQHLGRDVPILGRPETNEMPPTGQGQATIEVTGLTGEVVSSGQVLDANMVSELDLSAIQLGRPDQLVDRSGSQMLGRPDMNTVPAGSSNVGRNPGPLPFQQGNNVPPPIGTIGGSGTGQVPPPGGLDNIGQVPPPGGLDNSGQVPPPVLEDGGNGASEINLGRPNPTPKPVEGNGNGTTNSNGITHFGNGSSDTDKIDRSGIKPKPVESRGNGISNQVPPPVSDNSDQASEVGGQHSDTGPMPKLDKPGNGNGINLQPPVRNNPPGNERSKIEFPVDSGNPGSEVSIGAKVAMPTVLSDSSELKIASNKSTSVIEDEKVDAKDNTLDVQPETTVATSAHKLESPTTVKVNPKSTLPDETVASVSKQITDRLESMVMARRSGSVTIKLNPYDLGDVTLTVKALGNKVDAEIKTSNDDVRNALQFHKTDLLHTIESRGLSMNSFNVGQEPSNQAQGNGQQSQQSFQEAQRTANLQASMGSNSSISTENRPTGYKGVTSNVDLVA